MSNKSTPVQQRIQRFQTHTNGTPGYNQAAPNSASGGLRKKLLMQRTPKRISVEQSTSSAKDAHTDHLLNTAFTSGLVTPRPIPKPTTLNACYTPSSLYRNNNNKSTPIHMKSQHANSRTSTPNTNGKTKVQNSSNINNGEEMSNMTVAVRVRPLNALECTRPNVTNIVHVHANTNELTVSAGTTADASAGVTHFFSYDHVFYSCDPDRRNFANQQAVFEGTALPLIDTAFEGYNACLFAYGQTGSGKSYSMMGIEALDDAALDGNAPHAEAGIIPRFCHELFRRIEAVKSYLQVEIEVSYFEIYNEKIHDLLCVQQAAASTASLETMGTPVLRQALKVREHPIWGPYVVDLSVHSVDSYAALRNWLAVGNSQRATASTAMNDKSSRSHSIFNIVLNLTDITIDSSTTSISSDTDSGTTGTVTLRQTRRSKISLVDLAGSERINASGSNGERIREGVSINKSLLTLGKVIAALADSKKIGPTSSSFVPYRESVLTWLLRENLGGNSKTLMLATISPASIHLDETLATLRYACKARSIVNRVKVNESPHDKIIRDLRAEVDRLKSLRNEYERQKRLSGNSNPTPRKIIIETSVDESEVESLRQQLAERERELSRAQKSWMEKLKEAEDQRKSELRLLKRKGLALELAAEQQQACLVNLAVDPILSGTLFYLLPPGVVRIGRARTVTGGGQKQPDIVLDGPLVAQNHCTIEHEHGKLYVSPEHADFETYLNGELVHGRRQMYHGDRLVIGGSHYFRISNPFCTQRDRNKLVDFHFAHQEILQKQEQKLRLELEEEKRLALSRIEKERAAHERDFNERLQCLELEQLKNKYNRELLETERRALEEECAAINQEELSVVLSQTPSHKSTLLEDINRIMLNPSEESLHKTQLMVKEATHCCRSLGLSFEFRQTQTVDEFGMLRTTVLVLDKTQGLKAEWPTARLGVWLDMLRDNYEASKLTAETIFQSVEIDWQPLDADLNETLSDANNSIRIPLNLSAVKDALFKKKPLKQISLNQNATEALTPATTSTPDTGNMSAFKRFKQTTNTEPTPLPQHTKKMLTYDTDNEDSRGSTPDTNPTFAWLVCNELRDMQRVSIRLKRLCERAVDERENHSSSEYELAAQLRESLTRLDNVMHGIRNCVEQHVMQENRQPDMLSSPTKSTKAVRFLID